MSCIGSVSTSNNASMLHITSSSIRFVQNEVCDFFKKRTSHKMHAVLFSFPLQNAKKFCTKLECSLRHKTVYVISWKKRLFKYRWFLHVERKEDSVSDGKKRTVTLHAHMVKNLYCMQLRMKQRGFVYKFYWNTFH